MVDQIPELTNADALVGFRGAPFPPNLVDAAGAAVRGAARWHIAPAVEQTVEIYTGCASVAILPTLQVEQVIEVRDASAFDHGNDGQLIERWRLRGDAPVLVRPGGRPWPEFITVTMRHGYETCPAELLPLIADNARAAMAGGRVRQESLGGRSLTLEASATAEAANPASAAGTLARYALPSRP